MQLTHHAYFFEGSTDLLPEIAGLARDALGLSLGSPDASARAYEKFGIDDAHDLRNLAALKSVSGRSLVVVATPSITTEAQQALLKLFEEPQGGAVFVLIVPHGSLLPTLRSRCMAFPFEAGSPSSAKEAKEFLKLSVKERSTQIAELLDDEEGTRERTRELINALERELYAMFSKKGASAGERETLARGLSDLALFRKYLADRSPSLKMLLEHLAATLPRLS